MKKYEAPEAQCLLFAPAQQLASLNFSHLLDVGNTEQGGKGEAAISSDSDIKITI